ncbi:MAG: FAD-dependent oxidoreductase, partial [Pseudomonadota bacterium]
MTQTTVNVTSPPEEFDLDVETLIIGAGACGLVAALAAHENGQQVLVVEADTAPSGSTALSAGLIPAADTGFQRDAGIEDDPNLFATDIQSKAKGENDQALVDVLTKTSSTVIEWLAEKHKLPFSVVTDFDYPGHSRRRMHGLPSRAGSELIDALRNACEMHQIDIVCERRATTLFVENENIVGVCVLLPDGSKEIIGCRKLILACNGFGGNRPLVEQYMP